MRRLLVLGQQMKKVAHASPAPEAEGEQEPGRFVNSGSSLLNLALSDRVDGGWALGKMVHLVGDSSSGKTLLALTSLAEASRNADLKDHRLIYDDAEAAGEFNLPRLFGQDFADRLEAPSISESGAPASSMTVEEFERNIFHALERGPFIYLLDSWDAVSSEQEMGRTLEGIKQRDKGKTPTTGSYSMERQKKMAELLRKIVARLKGSNSLLFIISQTRDNIGSPFGGKTCSGGRALKFYASYQVWTSVVGAIRVGEARLKIGVDCEAKVKKNKVTGKERDIPFRCYYDYGIDDIGAAVDWLCKMGGLPRTKGKIDCAPLGAKQILSEKELIRAIEKHRLLPRLLRLLQATWSRLESHTRLDRAPRYE
jgi:RecA/RadA recombinase